MLEPSISIVPERVGAAGVAGVDGVAGVVVGVVGWDGVVVGGVVVTGGVGAGVEQPVRTMLTRISIVVRVLNHFFVIIVNKSPLLLIYFITYFASISMFGILLVMDRCHFFEKLSRHVMPGQCFRVLRNQM